MMAPSDRSLVNVSAVFNIDSAAGVSFTGEEIKNGEKKTAGYL